MGKGDTPRPVNKKKFDENFDKIFKKKPKKKVTGHIARWMKKNLPWEP